MKKHIFFEEIYQSDFDRNGFVKLKLFSDNEIDSLWEIFNTYLADREITSFLSTNFLPEKTERLKIANSITSIIEQKIGNTLTNVRLWHPAFLVKPIGENTEFKLHQDWTFVDEHQFYSGNLWFPLQDTDETNGTLYVIPKSHFAFVNSIRSHTIHEIFWEKDSILKPYCIPLNVKKGEVIFFQHSTIHYSSANLSNNKRIAINCGFNSNATPLKTYFRTNKTEAEEFIMQDNFVFEFADIADMNERPNGQFLQRITIPYQHTIDKPEDLIKLFINHEISQIH